MVHKYSRLILGIELLVAIVVWFAAIGSDEKFHLINCDVGQGDATLMVYGGTEILIDGGPDRKVLDCLGRHMPFWDRDLELVILTHPEKDHYGGLVDVFKRYKVNTFMFNDLPVISPDYQVLESLVGGTLGRVLRPLKGQHIRLGLIYLDVLAPDNVTGKELNLYSIVTEARFVNFTSLLTGDSQNFTFGANHHVQYIKVPHHGSNNGLSRLLLEQTKPDMAVISVGKNNYGHPTPEILQMLKDFGIKVFRTDQVGDVEVVSDGVGWRVN